MQTTTNIGLKTYEANDPTDWLGEFNYNMNKIDTAVGTQNQTITVIGADVTTAVNTANTANSTASEALQTANTKASINDSVASATTTYSGNKINDLISGIQPGTEIDDTVTSTTKTWSSSKINTELTSKASINDTTAGSNTTYSSNKSNNMYCKIPDYTSTETITGTTNQLNSRAFYNFGTNLPEGWYKVYFGCSAKKDTAPNDFNYVDLTINKNTSVVTEFYTEDVTQHWSTAHNPVIIYNSPLFYIQGGQISVNVEFDDRTTTDHKPLLMDCRLTRINPVE